MEAALHRYGDDQAVIERVLERLANLHAIDDEFLGRALIQETIARKAVGPLLLRSMLLRRGLPSELTERLVGEAGQNVDPVAQASALAQQRLASMPRLDERIQKQRLWGLLTRRGFETETIETALADLAMEDMF